jgi:2-polyprenyl-6-methoxyphenol hydroxylase-like FAD-dependent oxidoreductase
MRPLRASSRRDVKRYGALSKKTVAVVGAGPAGVVAAAQLARLGARVDVYERHTPQENALTRGWTIGLSNMARRALEAAHFSTEFPPELR